MKLRVQFHCNFSTKRIKNLVAIKMDTLKFWFLLFGLIHEATSELKVISENPTLFGDSPHWCALTESLYYVDFFGVKFQIYRFDYSTSRVHAAWIENAPPNAGFIIPINGYRNEFAVGFSDRKVKRIFWDGKSERALILGTLFEVEQDPYFKNNIWHVGKTDPYGRFYGGTMRTQLCTRSTAPDGSVYSYAGSRGVTKQIDYVELSNGFAHSLRSRKMFHINACEFVVKAYDCDTKTGKISNGKKLYQVFGGSDVPTYTGLGLAIDTEENLYVARWNGSSVVKVDSSTGKEIEEFKIPTAFTNNIAFGGPNLDEIFVVTGQLPFDLFTGGLKDQKLTPTAGFLYIIKNVNATGYKGKALRLN